MDSYCSIYIAKNIESHIFKELEALVDGQATNNSIEVPDTCYLDLVANSGYNQFLQSEFPDGFLYFKYRLEITFLDGVELANCVKFIGKVLKFLWANNFPAIATSDYENQLPLSGGYKSTLIPWPENISN